MTFPVDNFVYYGFPSQIQLVSKIIRRDPKKVVTFLAQKMTRDKNRKIFEAIFWLKNSQGPRQLIWLFDITLSQTINNETKKIAELNYQSRLKSHGAASLATPWWSSTRAVGKQGNCYKCEELKKGLIAFMFRTRSKSCHIVAKHVTRETTMAKKSLLKSSVAYIMT